MTRTILPGLGLFILLVTPAFVDAHEVDPVHEGRLDQSARYPYYRDRVDAQRFKVNWPYNVRGKKGRKYLRRASLAANLSGDKFDIYEEYGYTPHRLGINKAGKRYERWQYHTEGLEFVFDQEGTLVETHRIERQRNHID